MTLPNFIVVGAAKSGTTALWYYLSQHPQIFMCSPKEPNFFVADVINKGNDIRTLNQYAALFEKGQDYLCRGEASPAYLAHHKVSAARISETIPDCKIMVLLRNPVERVYSRYIAHFVRDKSCVVPFEDILDEIKWAEFHSKAVEHFQQRFGRENVGIFITEDMETDTADFLSSIWAFLGVSDISISDTRKINQSGVPRYQMVEKALTVYRSFPSFIKDGLRLLPGSIKVGMFERLRRMNIKKKPEMNPGTRRQLESFFKGEIESIETLTGRELKSRWMPGYSQ